MSERRRSCGFTLIEVLAVVLVTALLLGATISFYLNLSRQAAHAAETTREVRRAAALLDRIAGDLEHTVLVKKPAEEDALASPWLFVAESRYSQSGPQPASDQIKFIKRETPRSSDGPASDHAVIAYTLERGEDGETFALRRKSIPELPDQLDREFPRGDDPASLLVADDLSYFALRFLDEGGQWHDRWDSTLLADSSELPLAVEIEVALAPTPSSLGNEPSQDGEPRLYRRMVELPLRPLDLEKMLNPEEGEGTGTGEGDEETAKNERTLGECVDLAKLPMSGIPGFSESDLATLAAAVRNAPASSFKAYAASLVGIPGVDASCF